MRRNSIIYLVPSIIDEDEIGNQKIVDGTPRKLLAEKKSVRQSEFYQAATTDYKPEIVFTIWPHEYNDEPNLIYNNKKYRIIRTYEKSFKDLELVCEVRIGGN